MKSRASATLRRVKLFIAHGNVGGADLTRARKSSDLRARARGC